MTSPTQRRAAGTFPLRNLAAFQDDLFAIVVEAELRAHVALLAVAQDIAEATWSHVHLTMQILRLRCPPGESLVETLHKSSFALTVLLSRSLLSGIMILRTH
jgi:hypothetical protein